ncbi:MULTISPECIES: hypothetical protein [Lachnospiraceae]|nr:MULTISPECIES: hypothetical protein [Lachnospiraceae]UZT22279.1 hypothetical protein ORL52_04090 [Mediterraneibacter gnavus]UZT25763.1 hypothetical protein ORL61_04070 [Mediterraneibacter gnavus]
MHATIAIQKTFATYVMLETIVKHVILSGVVRLLAIKIDLV